MSDARIAPRVRLSWLIALVGLLWLVGAAIYSSVSGQLELWPEPVVGWVMIVAAAAAVSELWRHLPLRVVAGTWLVASLVLLMYAGRMGPLSAPAVGVSALYGLIVTAALLVPVGIAYSALKTTQLTRQRSL